VKRERAEVAPPWSTWNEIRRRRDRRTRPLRRKDLEVTTKPRIQPHHLDAEASVLGAVLLRNELITELPELETDDFYDMRHKVVWQAMRNLEAARRPIDVVTLEHEVTQHGQLEAIGGVAFFGELALRVPTVANAHEYATIVRQKATIRRLIRVAAELVDRGFDKDLDADEYLGEAMGAISSLDRAKPDDAKLIGDLAVARVKELELLVNARASGELVLTGIPTGVAGLDKRLGGWQRGIVNLLAARPAMGKTATAMSSADAASAGGFGVHQFVLEDGWRASADRALSRESGVSAELLRQGEIDAAKGHVKAVADAMVKLKLRTNWMLDDRAGLSADEIIRSVRRHRARLKTGLVIVDYVQLVRRNRELHGENEQLDEIITKFATAAKADDLAYLVLSQLNRKLEERLDKRPTMSDLRGSGSLEERPKVIVGQYRGSEYYRRPKRHVDYECDCEGKPAEACQHTPDDDVFAKTAQLLVLKNSNGQTGRVFATWNGPTTEIY
jgi:replicative DNA helicase